MRLILLAALACAGALDLSAQLHNPADLPTDGPPNDWTYHYLVFSNPGTEQQAIQNGTHDRWLKIVNDPRYIAQQLHRRQPAQGAGPGTATSALHPTVKAATAQSTISTDWSVDMGPGNSLNVPNGTALSPISYPAKKSLSTAHLSCAHDFAVFSTGSTGSATQATIAAFNSLYAGCGGAVPGVYWQYDTAGGDSALSPVLSFSGAQVAFVQFNCSRRCVSSLVVLKWKPDSALISLANTSASSYRACTAPCMTVLPFSNASLDYNSSPFYDYASDVLYVGDDSGALHKFTGVFEGNPAEARVNWPVTLAAGTYLAPPVFDPVSGNVFVMTSGGALYSVNGVTGAVVGTSNQLDFQSQTNDAPLVDAGAQTLYAFAGVDANGFSAIYQFPTSFTGGSGVVTEVGPGVYPLYTGAFDNIYLTSSASSPTGHLYVCGDTSDTVGNGQQLYQVSISANVMSPQTVVGSDAFGTGWCSPVTESYSASTGKDYIYLNVKYASYTGTVNCSALTGCFHVFDITAGAVPSEPLTALMEGRGTGGILVENAADLDGQMQIYFSPLQGQPCGTTGVGLCAIQLSQSAP